MEFLSPPLAKSILPYILSFVLLATHRLDSETLPVYVTLAFAILSVIWNLGFPAYARGLFPKDDIRIFIHFSLYNISIYSVVMLWFPDLVSFENKTYLAGFLTVLLDATLMIVAEHVFFQALTISNAQPGGYGIFHKCLWNSVKALWKFLNIIILSIVDMSVMMAQWIVVVAQWIVVVAQWIVAVTRKFQDLMYEVFQGMPVQEGRASEPDEIQGTGNSGWTGEGEGTGNGGETGEGMGERGGASNSEGIGEVEGTGERVADGMSPTKEGPPPPYSNPDIYPYSHSRFEKVGLLV